MSSNKLFILHFRPIENYPPVQNFIKTVIDFENDLTWSCITTKGQLESVTFTGFNIFRFGSFGSGKLSLWWAYFWYNLNAIIKLVIHRPNRLIYYESLSAFPAYIYKLLIHRKVKLYIHYHEYTSPSEYHISSPIERLFHKLEKSIYPHANWISHTNKVRLNKFLLDEELVFNKEVHQFLPNYPSKKWAILNKKRKQNDPLKLVYVGYSLTEEGSYLLELVDFLVQTETPAIFSIYCLKKNNFINNNEGSKKSLRIEIFDELAYSEIPLVLSKNHVGLILYKANTTNYIHNAPNKLFEYLSCGLDVWYPSEMQGIYEYDTNKSPLVKRLNFNKLSDYKLTDLLSYSQKSEEFTYCAEEVYVGLINKIVDE
jgi:hypothetical protein